MLEGYLEFTYNAFYNDVTEIFVYLEIKKNNCD